MIIKKWKQRRILAVMLAVTFILSFTLPAFANPVAGQAGDLASQRTFALSENGEYIIKYRAGASKSAAGSLMTQAKANVLKKSKDLALVRIGKADAVTSLALLAARPEIEYVEANLILKASGIAQAESSGGGGGGGSVILPSEPLQKGQWGLDAIDAPEAWGQLSDNPAEVTVAVIDTGVDYTHPELQDIVDTENGYDYVKQSNDAMDDNGHGTHVAGIISSQINGKGVAGVVYNANVKILPLKVLDQAGSGTLYNVAQAIIYATQKGADIINMSLGGSGYSRTLADAVTYAANNKVLVVAAAGNEADSVDSFIPASLPGVVAVGSVNSYLERSDFSNYGNSLDLAAPGERILSTIPSFVFEKGILPEELIVEDNEAYYAYLNGTSMATPFVSGVAALLKSNQSDLSGPELTSIIIANTIDLGENGFDKNFGYGLVNAALAMTGGNDPAETSVKIHRPSEGELLWGNVNVTLEVSSPSAGETIQINAVREETATPVAAIQMESDKVIYTYEWNTALLPDGEYTLTAHITGSETGDYVHIRIGNDSKTGLQFKILNPDGKPASNASVLIVHKGYWAGDGEESWPSLNAKASPTDDLMWLYEIVYSGFTNEEGYVNIPGSLAIDGNEFDIYVFSFMEDSIEGKEYPVLLHRSVEGPSLQVIDGSESQKVTFNLKDKLGNPLGNSLITVNYKEEEHGYTGWALPFGMTDEKGQFTGYIDKDIYGFQAVSYEASDGNDYVLMANDFRVGSDEEVQEIPFDLDKTGTLKIGINDDYYQQANLTLTGYGLLYWLFSHDITSGKSLVITEGQYYPLTNLAVSNDEKERWFSLFSDNGMNITSGESTLQAGGAFKSEINTKFTELEQGDYLSGSSVIRDVYGNRLIDGFSVIRKGASLQTFAFRGEDGRIKYMQWDPAKQFNESISINDVSYFDPELRIYCCLSPNLTVNLSPTMAE